ncbi:MAG: hypothetical protein ACFCGT_01690 [Sandaracinaceae bacterium]
MARTPTSTLDVDLQRAARLLADTFRDHPPVGLVRGKTAMRDALVANAGYSALRAEELVDQLERLGALRLEDARDPRGRRHHPPVWRIEPSLRGTPP